MFTSTWIDGRRSWMRLPSAIMSPGRGDDAMMVVWCVYARRDERLVNYA